MEENPSPSAAIKTFADDPSMFQALYTYDFATDKEFQAGLDSILGHPDVALSNEEKLQQQDLILQAQCFYYARKFNVQSPVEWQAYKIWLQNRGELPRTDSESSRSQELRSLNTSSTASPTVATTSAVEAATDAAPYPTSFSHIIDLITRNEPVPGVEQIPDTVLDAGMSQPSSVPKRKKPWEIDITGSPPTVASQTEPPNGVDGEQ